MPSSDFTITTSAGRVRVTGVAKTVRALEKAGADAEDMRDLMHSIGELVVHAARPPEVSGALLGTIRAGRGKTKAVVRAGSAAVPYAGVTHYGWPAHNIAPHPFLTTALQEERGAVFRELDRGIADILRKNNLT